MVMHNHGLMSCGRTAGEAFWFMYYLEASCKIQVDVLNAGTEYIVPEESAVSGLRKYAQPQEPPHGSREWPGLLRMLDKLDPGFRQ
jgi:ribulose-5-phosphate 4-epimerase/fuculose-1-phosphate aldolase